ncbi:MAG: hypothetical protein JO358_22665 [Alphaproteobacteria bacterium]|nr:hypothetical protein [Alphaproteobacteria bacterium]
MSRDLSIVLVAAALIALVMPASAQNIPPDPGAAANVRQSEQYEQVLRSNPSFRAKRMQEECGPINDPQLHQQCVESFGAGSAPPRKGKKAATQ